MKLNKQIADWFLADSREYLKRYEILCENSTYLGNRSKLLLDLIFALECLLKSIVFYESKKNEKETYGKICKHDLNYLFGLLSKKSQAKYKELIKEDLSKFYVGIRYQIESEIVFRNKNNVLDNRYYKTIANPVWLNCIYEQIKELLQYVEIINPCEIKITNFGNINIDNELEKVKILRNIRNEK